MVTGLALCPPDDTFEPSRSPAPVCAHDCLHVHWRWGARLGRSGLTPALGEPPVWLYGWEGGEPNTRQGAPLVPESQELRIELHDGHRLGYDADQEGAAPGETHVIGPHGAAYVVSPNRVADFLALPDDNETWGEWYHSIRHTARTGGEERLLFPNGLRVLNGE